jgi:hypothetical protein
MHSLVPGLGQLQAAYVEKKKKQGVAYGYMQVAARVGSQWQPEYSVHCLLSGLGQPQDVQSRVQRAAYHVLCVCCKSTGSQGSWCTPWCQAWANCKWQISTNRMRHGQLHAACAKVVAIPLAARVVDVLLDTAFWSAVSDRQAHHVRHAARSVEASMMSQNMNIGGSSAVGLRTCHRSCRLQGASRQDSQLQEAARV